VQTQAWDAEGKLTGITGGGVTQSNVYDTDGNRLIQKDATGVTVYLPGGQEVRATSSSTTATRWYSFAGQTVAVRTGKGLAGVSSIITDGHGTPVASVKNTDWTAPVTRIRTDPYGGARSGQTGSVAGHGFLGAPADATGLTLLGARFYDPGTGTFISPDPVLDPDVPAQFNAYVYAWNNPVTNADPTGLDPSMGVCNPYDQRGCQNTTSSGSSNSGPTNSGPSNSGPAVPAPEPGPAPTPVAPTAPWYGPVKLDTWQHVCEMRNAYSCPDQDPFSAAGGILFGVILDKASMELGGKGAVEVGGLKFLRMDAAAGAKGSIWKMGWAARGRAFEEMASGGKLIKSSNFPTIDMFEDGVATSIKSIDLGAPTYRNIGKLQSKLNSYVDKVSNFNGAIHAGIEIPGSHVTARALVVGVPNGVSMAQSAVLQRVISYGEAKGVTVTFAMVR